jgi:hypothetical protein
VLVKLAANGDCRGHWQLVTGGATSAPSMVLPVMAAPGSVKLLAMARHGSALVIASY